MDRFAKEDPEKLARLMKRDPTAAVIWTYKQYMQGHWEELASIPMEERDVFCERLKEKK